MKIPMTKFTLVKADMFKKMKNLIKTKAKDNIDRFSSRIKVIKMNITENHSSLITIPNNSNILTMSNNKIGVNNKDTLRKIMFNIKNIKVEGEDITEVKEAEDMEEDKGDIRGVDTRERNNY